MELAWSWWQIPAAVATMLSFALAIVVARAGPGKTSRRLAIVLIAEALVQLDIVIDNVVFHQTQSRSWDAASALVLGVLLAAYVGFLARLESPLARPLRARGVVAGAWLVLPLAFGVGSYATNASPGEETPGTALMGALLALCLIAVALGGLIVAYSTFRRTTPGTPTRTRAAAFTAAFGTRDVGWLALVAGTVIAEVVMGRSVPAETWVIVPPLITLAFVPILSYGLLKTQLFDIDLKIKVGIRRSTVVTIILVVALAAAKTAEFYLNRTYGWIAGGVAAGAMLVLAPRLNKMGEKVAMTAMPKVENTSTYVEFRKMEVYKTALESALEGGPLTSKERATLERLRAKLGIREEDARALEADVAASLPPSGAQPDASSA